MSLWNKFKDIQLDTLKEIGNIGAGNAATSLSCLLHKTIEMKVPDVSIVGFDDIAEVVGGPEEVVVSVFLRIEGDLPGFMFFTLTTGSAAQLLESMQLGKSGEEFNELEISALQEVGNILSGSYLSALADFTGLNLQPSVPALAIDMAAAILSYGLIEVGKVGDYALLIDTTVLDFSASTESNIQGKFFLLLDPDSFTKLFTTLGVPLDE
jgi:chemotaxis protein CheC